MGCGGGGTPFLPPVTPPVTPPSPPPPAVSVTSIRILAGSPPTPGIVPILRIGEQLLLTAEPLDKEGKVVPDAKVDFTSRDPEIARILPVQGNQVKVEALRTGIARIQASVGSVSSTLEVTVITTQQPPPPPPPVGEQPPGQQPPGQQPPGQQPPGQQPPPPGEEELPPSPPPPPG